VRTAAAFALATSLLRCATDPTGVFVRVTVDPAVRIFAGAAQVRVFDADAMPGGPPAAMGSVVAMPNQTEYTLFVEKRGAIRRVRIEVEGYGIATRPEEQRPMAGEILDRAIVTYVADQVFEVDLRLQAACRTSVFTMPCQVTDHCAIAMVGAVSLGRCAPATVQNPRRHTW